MKQLKKLFGTVNKTVNKTVDNLKPFPEYAAMDTALQDAGTASVKYTSQMNESTSHYFTEFSNKQPLTVSEVLTDIQNQMNQRISVLQSNNESYRNLRQGLQQIQPLNQQMRERRKHLRDLQGKAEKANKNLESAKIKYNKMNIKNPSSPETMKLKSELDLCASSKDFSDKELENYMTTFVVENKQYKKELFTAMLNILYDFAMKYSETCEQQIPITQEISKFGSLIPEYTDSGIQAIQEELDSLKASLTQSSE